MLFSKKNKKDILYLVLSGGGIPGLFAFQGALDELAKRRKDFSFQKIKGVAGSSVGSVGALMVALNFSSKEMEKKLSSFDLSKFQNKHPWKHPIKNG